MGFGLGCGRAGDERSLRVAERKAVITSPSVTPSQGNPTESRSTLPRSARLRGNSVFQYLWKFGISQRENFLSLRAVFFSIVLSEFPIKAAFLVRKKVLRRAVHRNRVRRLLREAHRSLYPEWQASSGTAEAWLLWIWESERLPSLKELRPLMKRLYERAYTRWERSLSF